jgi:beta-glucosidase/6-phospho-beta-glucosidase/beta-galactosidase
VEQVLAEDVDVRGYLSWSSFDNFEWARGYAPTFGLVEVDRADGFRRIPRRSVPPPRPAARGRRFGPAPTPGSSGHER